MLRVWLQLGLALSIAGPLQTIARPPSAHGGEVVLVSQGAVDSKFVEEGRVGPRAGRVPPDGQHSAGSPQLGTWQRGFAAEGSGCTNARWATGPGPFVPHCQRLPFHPNAPPLQAQ
jgi:hypothetical protein